MILRRHLLPCGKEVQCLIVMLVQWAHLGSPDKHRGLSIQPCKSEREKSYILCYILRYYILYKVYGVDFGFVWIIYDFVIDDVCVGL